MIPARLVVLPLLSLSLSLHAADPSATSKFRITSTVDRPKDKVPALGVNSFGGSGAVEWAANNFVQNSGNEPIYWRNLHRVTTSGSNWFEIDGPGTSGWDLYASGFLSGANLRIYRLVDSSGNPVSQNGGAPDMSRADRVALVGTTRIIPEGAPGFPDGGWVASKYAEVHPNVNIQWGNHRVTDTSGVLNGRTYWYSVVAIGEGGVLSDLSAEVSATPAESADGGPRLLVLSRDDRLPAVSIGTGFSVQPLVFGGQAPLVWSVVDVNGNPTALPGGLTLNSQTGLISGTPTATVAAGTPLRLKVTDAANRSDTRTWLMNPAAPVASGHGKPLPPTNIQAVAGNGGVTISWTPSSSPGVTGYALRRSTAPLSQQVSRVYVVEGAPQILPYDHVVLERRFDPFEMRYVNSRVRGIGGSPDRLGWNWNVSANNVHLRPVPHPQPVPAEMLDPGETCMEAETLETGPVSISQTVLIGTEHNYESVWYGQFEPGKTYRLEVWMRQEGLMNNGAVTFSYGSAYPGIGTSFQVTGGWQKFTYDFTGPPRPTGAWHFGHRFAFTGPGKLWMDNCRIFRVDQPTDLELPYVPNQTVLDELLTSAPTTGPKGAHRCWVLTRDLTMDHILSWHGNSQVRPDWYTGVGGTGEMMLPKALEWCRKTGDSAATRVVPWIVIQHILHSEEDWRALVEYLAAPYDPATDTPESKPWAYRRYQQRGVGTPWMDEFREVIIEFGNETWHNGHNDDWLGFGGHGNIWQGGKSYGMFSRYLIEAMQASPHWAQQQLTGRLRFALGDGYVFNGEGLSYGEEAMRECPQADILARANYVGPKWETGDVSSGVFDDEGIQETLLSYPAGEEETFRIKKATRDAMAAAGHAYDIAAYEGGPSGYALPNTASAEIVDVNERYGKSLAMAVASLDAWLGSYHNGWTYQAFFSYGQGLYWNSHTPLWNGFRPTPGWQAMALRNKHARGDLMTVNTTSVATVGRLGKEIPLVACHAFREGTRWTVILLNRKLGGTYRGQDLGDGSLPVELKLPFNHAGAITLHKLSGDPRANNRDALTIAPESLPISASTLSSTNGSFVVNQATGAIPGGLPAGSILIYVFEGTSQVNPPANIAYEGFNYTPGTDLSTQTQPAEFQGWVGGRTPGYTPAAGSLTYSNGGTLATSGQALSGGNAWQTTGMALNFSSAAWNPYKVNVDNQYTLPHPGASSTMVGEDNTTLYVSFLLQNTSDQAVFGLYTDGLSASQPWDQMSVGAAVRVTSSGNVSLRTGSYTAGTFDTGTKVLQDALAGSVTPGSTNLYVLKIEFGAAGNGQDMVTAFVNPTVGSEEPAAASASILTTGNLVFSAMGIYLGNTAGSSKFDELRFGATWENVVPSQEPTLNGFAAWFDFYGLPTDGTGDGSPDAILAGDGIKNLMKYALGIDPEVSGYQGHYSTGTTTVGDSDYLSLTYTRPEPAPEGVTYLPQACDDLSDWSGAGLVEVSSTVSGGLRTITVRDGTAIDDASRRFLRLMVTAP